MRPISVAGAFAAAFLSVAPAGARPINDAAPAEMSVAENVIHCRAWGRIARATAELRDNGRSLANIFDLIDRQDRPDNRFPAAALRISAGTIFAAPRLSPSQFEAFGFLGCMEGREPALMR